MNKSILIISYVFPPYPGIGGRRWAKFAKYLAKKGYKIHVICAENIFEKKSEWTKDVNNTNIIKHLLPGNYPEILLKEPKSVFEKIKYRLNVSYLKLLTKGNIYERSIFWKKPLLKSAIELIKQHNIKNVIATGAPFHLLHHSLELKKEFSGLNLIIDIRDQWTDNVSFGGYRQLSKARFECERKLEYEVITHADKIITVADHMTQVLSSKAKKPDNFITMPNGYDPDDLSLISNTPEDSLDKRIKFIFTGNLYNELENIFYPFLEMVLGLKKTSPDIYEKIVFSFYGNYPNKYEVFVKENNLDNVRFGGVLPLKQVLSKISQSDYCMLFLNDDHTFTMSTKFFEYMAFKKKVVVFSNGGELGEYVEKENIGYSCCPENIEIDFKKIIENKEKGDQFNPEFDITRYSIETLTKRLEELFI